MSSRINVNRLVSQLARPNAPAFLTPTDQFQMHLAVIDSHDAGRNESTAVLNDFGNPTLSRIPVLQAYSNADMPQAGDIVQLIQIGQTLAVLGRQYRPTGVVSFS